MPSIDKLLPRQRREAILHFVTKSGSASVAQLARMMNVSPSTVRRDLNALKVEGLLDRVHGGVTIEEEEERQFSEVSLDARADKDRIAYRASNLVPDFSVVVLDIGTTTAAIARQLAGRPLTVVTASLAVIDELRHHEQTQLIVLGGVVRSRYHSMVGSLTENAVSQLVADYAFIGTSGITADGVVLDSTGTEVPIKHAIIKHSRRVFLAASDNKFPGSGILPVCNLSDLTGIITTAARDHPTLTQLKDTEVFYA